MKSISTTQSRFSLPLARPMVLVIVLVLMPGLAFGQSPFHLEEATINDIHNAIKGGQISCQGLVQAYINRAKAYNGVCTQLVTRDGAPVPSSRGAVRRDPLSPSQLKQCRYRQCFRTLFSIRDAVDLAGWNQRYRTRKSSNSSGCESVCPTRVSLMRSKP